MSRATLVPCFRAALSTLDLQPTTYRGPDEALTMTVRDHISLERWDSLNIATNISHHPAVSALPQ
jgi:DNA/RNA-binding domain of Phe-tRNA-synthetase-like protein